MRQSQTWANVRIGIALLAMFLVVGVVDSPLFTFYRISGNSMRPAYHDGDRVIVTSLPLLFGGPDLGDTVIVRHDGEVLIKRILGRPGDNLEVRAGVVFIDGVRAEEPPPAGSRDYWSHGPVRLAANEYFLMGDNRRVSVDSRTFGPVAGDSIIGRVVVRIAGDEDHAAVTAAER